MIDQVQLFRLMSFFNLILSQGLCSTRHDCLFIDYGYSIHLKFCTQGEYAKLGINFAAKQNLSQNVKSLPTSITY